MNGRADGSRELYHWLVDHDLLVVKADRAEPLLVPPLRLAIEIATLKGLSRHPPQKAETAGRSCRQTGGQNDENTRSR
jgi:hypothetical protein